LTFALLKRCFSASSFQRLENPQCNKVVKIRQAYFCATTSHLYIEALMRLGLILHLDSATGEIILQVDREMAAKARKAGDVHPDAPVPLCSDAHKRIPLPGRQNLKGK
jgi:hypothetical protein